MPVNFDLVSYLAGMITGLGLGVGLYEWVIPFGVDIRNSLMRHHRK